MKPTTKIIMMFVFILLQFKFPLLAIDAEEANLGIRSDWIKIGPIFDPGRHTFYQYYSAGTVLNRTKPEDPIPPFVAAEYFDKKQRIKLEFYKDGKLDGIQREWYNSGQIKSEATYVNGVREGIFRNWDEEGALVGEYQFLHGTGLARIYYPDGHIKSENEYKNNVRDGADAIFTEDGTCVALEWSSGGAFNGRRYTFTNRGVIAGITYLLPQKPDAPTFKVGYEIAFDDNGRITECKYYLNNKEVSAAEYKKASEKDAQLPPYFDDLGKYRTLDTQSAEYIRAKERLPLVRIPVVLDVNGNPVPAGKSKVNQAQHTGENE